MRQAMFVQFARKARANLCLALPTLGGLGQEVSDLAFPDPDVNITELPGQLVRAADGKGGLGSLPYETFYCRRRLWCSKTAGCAVVLSPAVKKGRTHAGKRLPARRKHRGSTPWPEPESDVCETLLGLSLAKVPEHATKELPDPRSTDAVERVLPTVIKPPPDANLTLPLITESRGIFGKYLTYDNPWAPGATAKTSGELWKVMRSPEMGKIPTAQERKTDLPPAEVELAAIANHGDEDPMRVTWIGHATVLLQMDGLNILTDPIFSDRASASQLVGPKRYTPPAMLVSDLPHIDLVLLSHNHYDHLDTGSVKAIGDGPLWVVPSGLKGYMSKLGITNCTELSWWEEIEVEGSRGAVRVASTPAQHWSTRGIADRNLSLWCGFAVLGSNERFFFAGDTGYCPIFCQIGDRFGPFDIAAIPIGAHKPTWFMKESHCSPEQAVTIHRELGAKRSLGVHWGTFSLAADSHSDPPRELVEACRARGLRSSEFSVVRHGESLVNDGSARRYECVFGSDNL